MSLVPRDTHWPLLRENPRAFVRRYRWTLLALLVAATADVVTTLVNLHAYGTGVEVHLVQRLVSDTVGVTVGVPLAKLLQLCFVIAVAAWWRPWCPWILRACALLYGLAALSNHFLWL